VFQGVKRSEINTHFVLHLQNFECESCEFHVTDGPIREKFVVKKELVLKTKSNAVDANITMISCTSGVPSRPVVDITTTTGSINANFTLVEVDARTKEKLSSEGVYEITTRSRHAPVRLEVVDAPVDSALKIFSKNTRGPLEVHLHPTYQGKFSSEALIGSAPLGIRGYVEDPSGRERKRTLGWNGWSIPPGIKHVLSGEVWWGDRPEHPLPYRPYALVFSNVQLKTIMGQPLIFLHVSDPDVPPTPTD
jgi:hypothetical protein